MADAARTGAAALGVHTAVHPVHRPWLSRLISYQFRHSTALRATSRSVTTVETRSVLNSTPPYLDPRPERSIGPAEAFWLLTVHALRGPGRGWIDHQSPLVSRRQSGGLSRATW